MNIGLSTLYNIGSNYAIKLNEKELLVYEEDDSQKKGAKSEAKNLEKEQEKKRAEKEKSPEKLSPDEERLVKDLALRDSQVKTHEGAHQAAGGGMTGAASYTYQQGPDGKMYAIGGEVSISMKSGATPEETARNARQMISSAMAASNPSPQDFAVASSARILEMKALQQIAKQTQEALLGKETYKNEASKNIVNENAEDKSKITIPA